MAIALDLGGYGDISDYSSLVEKIRLWLDRGSELDEQIPTFISLLEDYLNDMLRTPDMEAVGPVSAIDGTFKLPLDFEQMRGLTYNARPLNSTSPEQLATRFGELSGIPSEYAISGRSVLIAPRVSGTLILSYYQRIPRLNLNNPINWLIDRRPAIYLYGALATAEGYIENPERASQWGGLFEASVERYANASTKARHSGPMVMRSPVREMLGAIGGREYVRGRAGFDGALLSDSGAILLDDDGSVLTNG